jgi:hypothetical protein
MTHRYVLQLQKARERLVAHRREMAEIIINTAVFIPERAAEFTEIYGSDRLRSGCASSWICAACCEPPALSAGLLN